MKVVNKNLNLQTNYFGIKASNGFADVHLWSVQGKDMFVCAMPSVVDSTKLFDSYAKAEEYCKNLTKDSPALDSEKGEDLENILKTKRVIEYKFSLSICGDSEDK